MELMKCAFEIIDFIKEIIECEFEIQVEASLLRYLIEFPRDAHKVGPEQKISLFFATQILFVDSKFRESEQGSPPSPLLMKSEKPHEIR
jgi:hypothetical protein